MGLLRHPQTTTRKGQSIGYSYDAAGRLTQVSRPEATTGYQYDAAGRLIQIQEGSMRLAYEYDAADRLTRAIQDTPAGYHTIDYRYDSLDRRISRKVDGGDESTYAYNKAGQLSEIRYRGEATGYAYDGAGRLTRKTLPGGLTQDYAYDETNRLTQIQYKNGTTFIEQLDLQYDPEGNITRKTLANGSLKQDSPLTASHDAANRMTSVTVNGKSYTLTHDANGNLTQKQNGTDPADTTTYTWDSRNRLTRITAPNLTASFGYDPLGRRIERTVNGVTTAYVYDGAQAIGEVRNGQGSTLLTGLAIDEAIARYGSGGRLTQLTDQLGSVIRQINESGATQSSTAYSPYGEAQTSGNGQGNSTGFTGREDDGTGLTFYRARYYDPVLKRWISEDPIGTAGGINLYGYVGGNPIVWTDPFGLVKAVCKATGTAGTGYSGGNKVCEYACTANGKRFTVKGYCDDYYGEKICYGVPVDGVTSNAQGVARAHTGDPRDFPVDTDSLYHKYIKYDSRLLDEIDANFAPPPRIPSSTH